MVTARSDSYAAASGGGVFAGIAGGSSLPAWVPPQRQFANIGTATINGATPSTWPKGKDASPFNNWASGAWCEQFGTRGGYAIHGGGHLGPSANLGGGVWVLDVELQTWVGRCVPSDPLAEPPGTNYNAYGESTDAGNLGHPYPAHTYQGLLYQSPANGGGSQGSLVRVCHGAHGFGNNKSVVTFDLSSTTAAPTRRINDLFPGNADATYIGATVDTTRGGFWAQGYNGNSNLVFVDFADWSVTNHNVTHGGYGSFNLVHVPTRDCLVAIGEIGNDPTLACAVYVCPIVADVPQGWTLVTQGGTIPSEFTSGFTKARFGGEWSSVLGCIVSWPGPDSDDLAAAYVAYKLAVPANLTAGTWTWTTETLTAQGSEVPPHDVNINNGQFYQNGTWSRFREAPNLKCFILANSLEDPAQAWRLTGMV